MPVLVILHIGEQWPHYLHDCIKQARLLNPVTTTEIVVLVNQCHSSRVHPLQALYTLSVTYIEDLPDSDKHREFVSIIRRNVDLQFRRQYWQYVFERFFLLEMFMKEDHRLYMIETDNLLYVPLSMIEQTENLFSQDLAAPFDNLDQGYPSIMFFRNKGAIVKFTDYMLEILRKGYISDMKILGQYRREHPDAVFPFPVLPSCCNKPLRHRHSRIGHETNAEDTAFLSDARHPFVFDAIAYGQAIGGIDPRNTNGINTAGFINESALYTILETEFKWIHYGTLWLPFVNEMPLVNLHIHSKALSNFLSDRNDVPTASFDAKELKDSLENDFHVSLKN